MDDTLQAAREAFQQRFQDLATQFRQNHAAWQKAVRANLATTSWVFRAFGDVSLAGTPR